MDYDYEYEMKKDIEDWLDWHKDDIKDLDGDDLYEYCYEKMWIDDSITGNASGSYTFNTYRAEEYLCHNIDLLMEALEHIGLPCEVSFKGAEYCDVTIRCYLLDRVLREVLEND